MFFMHNTFKFLMNSPAKVFFFFYYFVELKVGYMGRHHENKDTLIYFWFAGLNIADLED